MWVTLDTIKPFGVGPYTIISLRKFLPAGRYEKNGVLIDRTKSLIQVYTDPGGIRTVTAASIRFKDPGRTW